MLVRENAMKIVVLDDSKTVLLTMRVLLEDLGVDDEEIYLFEDGHEALSYIEHNGADIIFSDINMPGMNGFEFVERLLEVSDKFVSVLFVVSGDDTGNSVAQMKKVGGKRFIRKPINSKHFNHFVLPEIHKIKSRSKVKEQVQPSKEVIVEQNDRYAVDYEKLAEQMGLKVKHIPRLMNSFMDESQVIMEKLKDAVEYRYYEQIEKYAHSLKGSSGNMHFIDLSELCRMMEHAARDEDNTFDYAVCQAKIAEELSRIKL
jgi:CheY-like chemotaxis protein